MGLKDLLRYAGGSAGRNGPNMVRAGNNNVLWGAVGGALLGSVAFPVGTILGAFVGGLLGSTVRYGRS